MVFWVGSTGKFSSGAGQITLQRLAHFFFFVSESSPNKLRHIRSKKKRPKNVGRVVLGSRQRKVSSRRVYFSFLELTVSFDFELSS